MKKILLFTALAFLIISCSSLKNTQEAISNGNYDSAINTAIENLKRNKTKKEISLISYYWKKLLRKQRLKIWQESSF